jgi:DNA-binding GntR family transcriptional regulator
MRIRRETVTEQCVQLLRREILERRLLPGTPLTEEAIARDMGVSRPTVREVISMLTAEGLLTRNPSTRALCVTRVSPDEIREIYRARRLLEAGGVTAFGEREDAALDPLVLETGRLVAAIETGDNRVIVKHDIACHVEIVALVGSSDLVQFYARLLAKLRLSMTGATRSRQYDMRVLRDDHLRTLALLRERRIEQARRFIVDRLDRAEKQVLDAAAS